eukprot:m.15278 g.15278  ORF g.15278 m.15278 type:complete len:268 (+) comp26278_c0_seq2:46-849(+)
MPRARPNRDAFVVQFETEVDRSFQLPGIDKEGMTRDERENWWKVVVMDFDRHMADRLEQVRRDKEDCLREMETAMRQFFRAIPKELRQLPFKDVVQRGRCFHEAITTTNTLKKEACQEKEAAVPSLPASTLKDAANSVKAKSAKSTTRKRDTTRRTRPTTGRRIATRSVTRSKAKPLQENGAGSRKRVWAQTETPQVTPFCTRLESKRTNERLAVPVFVPVGKDSPGSMAAKEAISEKLHGVTKGLNRAGLLKVLEAVSKISINEEN